MTQTPATAEFLVLSRGQWDPKIPPETIQQAIDGFYVWLARHIDEGTMRTGSRLATEGKTVAKNHLITDGPFGETKEVIGGYWIIRAQSLDKAAAIAADSPTLPCGLFYEIRPLDPVPASAFSVTNETPADRGV